MPEGVSVTRATDKNRAGAALRRTLWIVDFVRKNEILTEFWGTPAHISSRGGVSHSHPRPKTVRTGVPSYRRSNKGAYPFAVQ